MRQWDVPRGDVGNRREFDDDLSGATFDYEAVRTEREVALGGSWSPWLLMTKVRSVVKIGSAAVPPSGRTRLETSCNSPFTVSVARMVARSTTGPRR